MSNEILKQVKNTNEVDTELVQLCLDFVKKVNELQRNEDIEISINIENSNEADLEE